MTPTFLSTWTLYRGCGARPQLSISLSPPVRKSPEAVLEPTARGQRPLQQGPVRGLPLRCGAEELFLWKALLGSGHESHRGCTLGLGGVQGQCEPKGQGAEVPRKWLLGSAAVQGEETSVPVTQFHSSHSHGASQPHGYLPGLPGRGGVLLQRERWVSLTQLLPGCLPWAAAAILLLGDSKVGPNGHLHSDHVGEGIEAWGHAQTLGVPWFPGSQGASPPWPSSQGSLGR